MARSTSCVVGGDPKTGGREPGGGMALLVRSSFIQREWKSFSCKSGMDRADGMVFGTQFANRHHWSIEFRERKNVAGYKSIQR